MDKTKLKKNIVREIVLEGLSRKYKIHVFTPSHSDQYVIQSISDIDKVLSVYNEFFIYLQNNDDRITFSIIMENEPDEIVYDYSQSKDARKNRSAEKILTKVGRKYGVKLS